jgi:hypothetical protein
MIVDEINRKHIFCSRRDGGNSLSLPHNSSLFIRLLIAETLHISFSIFSLSSRLPVIQDIYHSDDADSMNTVRALPRNTVRKHLTFPIGKELLKGGKSRQTRLGCCNDLCFRSIRSDVGERVCEWLPGARVSANILSGPRMLSMPRRSQLSDDDSIQSSTTSKVMVILSGPLDRHQYRDDAGQRHITQMPVIPADQQRSLRNRSTSFESPTSL